MHYKLVKYPITRYGSDAQKSKYLPMLTSDTVGAYALSESGSGSDAFGLAARAEKKGDRWILNGQKLWITNGAEAGIFVVFANANPSALSLIHISEPTRLGMISYAVFCLK